MIQSRPTQLVYLWLCFSLVSKADPVVFFLQKSHGLVWMNDNAIMPETKNKNIHHWSSLASLATISFSSPFFSEARNLPGALRYLRRFGLQALSSARRDLALRQSAPSMERSYIPTISGKTQQKPRLKSGYGAVFSMENEVSDLAKKSGL